MEPLWGLIKYRFPSGRSGGAWDSAFLSHRFPGEVDADVHGSQSEQAGSEPLLSDSSSANGGPGWESGGQAEESEVNCNENHK